MLPAPQEDEASIGGSDGGKLRLLPAVVSSLVGSVLDSGAGSLCIRACQRWNISSTIGGTSRPFQ
jgi:hypothetical protein